MAPSDGQHTRLDDAAEEEHRADADVGRAVEAARPWRGSIGQDKVGDGEVHVGPWSTKRRALASDQKPWMRKADVRAGGATQSRSTARARSQRCLSRRVEGERERSRPSGLQTNRLAPPGSMGRCWEGESRGCHGRQRARLRAICSAGGVERRKAVSQARRGKRWNGPSDMQPSTLQQTEQRAESREQRAAVAAGHSVRDRTTRDEETRRVIGCNHLCREPPSVFESAAFRALTHRFVASPAQPTRTVDVVFSLVRRGAAAVARVRGLCVARRENRLSSARRASREHAAHILMRAPRSVCEDDPRPHRHPSVRR